MYIRPCYFAIVVFTALALAPSVSHATNLSEDPRVSDAINLVDRWIDAQRDYLQIPGISVAVVHDQEVLWSAGFGYADLEGQKPTTAGTVYSICSISKLFTSVAAMQLRDKGKFRLDDPVNTLLPWFQPRNAYPEGPSITIEGLLTHSSGIPEGTGHSDMPPFNLPSHDQIVADVPKLETLYPAWQHENYSNLGLILVGEIVAQLSGQPYGEYIKEHVLAPLGMASTIPEIGDLQGTGKLASGYSAPRRDGNRKKVEPFAARGMTPAYGFASTVEDLAKFASWQFRLLETGQYEILQANTLREMQRVHYLDPGWQTSWGLGFMVTREGGETFVGHGGFCPGYQSDLLIQLDSKIATIAIANAMIPIWSYTARAYEIVAPAIDAAKDTPGKGKAIPSNFQKYIGTYNSFPFSGEFQVIPWKGDLAVVRFPIDNPMTVLRRLKHIEGATFRHIREGNWLGAEYVFEVDVQGQVVRMVIDKSPLPRVR